MTTPASAVATPPAPGLPARFLYVFLDEGGNLDFSPSGTKYFILSSLTKERPFFAGKELIELKYDLVEQGTNLEYFHAAEDRQAVRNAVFGVIAHHLAGVQIDSLVVEKRKVPPGLRADEAFYPTMLGVMLKSLIHHLPLSEVSEVIVFTDSIPVSRRRQAIEKAVKTVLAGMLPAGMRYRVYHHDSKSNYDLQIADYCNWAIYRKWSSGDERSYNFIRSAVRKEFELYRDNTDVYY